MSIKSLAPYGHFQLIKWIFGYVIGIELVDFPYGNIDVRLMRFAEKQELCASEGLETGEAEERGFEDFDTSALGGG